MPVPDDEPQYWLRDNNGNLIGAFYEDADGNPAIVDENGNEASLEDDGTWDVPGVTTDEVSNRFAFVAPNDSFGYGSIQAAIDSTNATEVWIYLVGDTSEGDITANKTVHIRGVRQALASAGSPADINIPSGSDGLHLNARESTIANVNIIGPNDGTCTYGLKWGSDGTGMKMCRSENVSVFDVAGGPGEVYRGVHSSCIYHSHIRGCNVGRDVDLDSASGDYFNNCLLRWETRGSTGDGTDITADATGPGFSGNVIIFRAENDGGNPINVTTVNFVGNQFLGYGPESNGADMNINPDTGSGNKWLAGLNAGPSRNHDFIADGVWSHTATNSGVDARGMFDRAYLSADQSVASGSTWTPLAIDTASDTQLGYFDSANNQFDIPANRPGNYEVRVAATWSALSAGETVRVGFQVNGATVERRLITGNGGDDTVEVSGEVKLSGGDTVTPVVRSDSANSETVGSVEGRTNVKLKKV